MNLVVVSLRYWPEPVFKPSELAEGLAKLGHSVTVITGYPTYPAGKIYRGYRMRGRMVEQRTGVRVIRVPLLVGHDRSSVGKAMTYVSFMVSGYVFGLSDVRRADLVYVWGNPPTSGLLGWMLARSVGAPLVYGVHDLWPELAAASDLVRGPALRVIDLIERFVLRRADGVTAISQGFRSALIEKGARADRVSVFPHWADDGLYVPPASRGTERENLGTVNQFVVLYAGNIGTLQGLETLIEAAEALRDLQELQVVIAGDGRERDRLEYMVRDRQLRNVRFIGSFPPERMPRLFAAADLLYVSLVGDPLARLSIPSKLASYLACARPVLSTVPGEAAELLNSTHSGLTVAHTPSAVAEGIRRAMRMTSDERNAMGERGRAVFLRVFTKRFLLDAHDELFQRIAREA